MIELSDLEIDGLSEADRAKHRAHIAIRIVDALTLELQSERKPDVWYEVLHDGYMPVLCKCPWGKHHGGECEKHFARVQLVLNRRIGRLNKAKDDRRRAEAPLNGNQGFSLLR